MIIRDTALIIAVEDRKHSSSVVEVYNSFTLRWGEFGGDMTQVSDSFKVFTSKNLVWRNTRGRLTHPSSSPSRNEKNEPISINRYHYLETVTI